MLTVNGKLITMDELREFIMALEPDIRKRVIKEILVAILNHDGSTKLTIILENVSIH
jgi:hypothetical protein